MLKILDGEVIWRGGTHSAIRRYGEVPTGSVPRGARTSRALIPIQETTHQPSHPLFSKRIMPPHLRTLLANIDPQQKSAGYNPYGLMRDGM